MRVDPQAGPRRLSFSSSSECSASPQTVVPNDRMMTPLLLVPLDRLLRRRTGPRSQVPLVVGKHLEEAMSGLGWTELGYAGLS